MAISTMYFCEVGEECDTTEEVSNICCKSCKKASKCGFKCTELELDHCDAQIIHQWEEE